VKAKSIETALPRKTTSKWKPKLVKKAPAHSEENTREFEAYKVKFEKAWSKVEAEMANEQVRHEAPKPVTHTGAKAPEHKAAALNIGQPEIRMKEAPDKPTEMGKSIREHVEEVMKKHAAGDPNLPSPTETTVRALSLRCLQLLAEVEAIAAQIELYEVPKEDDEKRAEAKKNEAKAKEAAPKAKEHA
jgi:hypothetical protein